MRLSTSSLLLALPIVIFAGAAQTAYAATPVPVVTFRADAKGFKGDSTVARVRVIIPKGWHIQSNAPLDEYLIPTEVKASGEGLCFGKPVFPEPVVKELDALGGKVALFEDTLDIRVTARATKKKTDPKVLAAALENSSVTLRYQACNDSQCLPPKEVKATFAR